MNSRPPQTGNWAEFREVELGKVRVDGTGNQVVTVRARDTASWKAINLRSVTLTRVE